MTETQAIFKLISTGDKMQKLIVELSVKLAGNAYESPLVEEWRKVRWDAIVQPSRSLVDAALNGGLADETTADQLAGVLADKLPDVVGNPVEADKATWYGGYFQAIPMDLKKGDQFCVHFEDKLGSYGKRKNYIVMGINEDGSLDVKEID